MKIFLVKRNGTVCDYPSSAPAEFMTNPEIEDGRTLAEVFPAHVVDQAVDAVRAVLDTGVIQVLEYEISEAFGSKKFEARFARPTQNEAMIVVRNITEARVTAEESEKHLNKMLGPRKQESLGVLAGGIAHEFNNLLTGIIGNASLARMSLAEGTSPEECIVQIETAALRAAVLTNQLLAYSGKAFYSTKPISLSKLVADTIDRMQRSLPAGCTIRSELSEDLADVEADQGQVRQLIMNLILNSSEAQAKEGGVITLTTEMSRLSADEISGSVVTVTKIEEEYVCLQVQDSGEGMTQEVLSRIFDPFFTTKFAGRGLGLSAVLGIVRGHEGAILVDSKKGVGTRVRVLLPVSIIPASSEYEIDNPALEPGTEFEGSGKILIIDDEKLVLDVARQSLERAGFDVITAATGREGVAIFKEDPGAFRAVLLDMTLPDLNGKDVYRMLRKLHENAIILLTSGHAEQSVTERFSREELAGFIKKPFRPAELLRKFQQALTSPA